MTYLIGPRIHFAGQFQADVSTVNNSFPNFDVHSPDQPPPAGGAWNPGGSGTWGFSNCVIGAGVFADGREVTTPAGDAAIGVQLASNGGIPPKLVDLDTEQQMVSQIFGMTLSLGPTGASLMTGTFETAPFTDIWVRPLQNQGTDDRFSAVYQSVLTGVTWGNVSQSPLLQALQAATEAGLLSIRFNVDGFDDHPMTPNFTVGRVVGTIGVASSAEPKHFVVGRQFRPAGSSSPLNYFAGILDPARGKLVLDMGNAFETATPGGNLVVPPNIRLVARGAQSDIDLGPVAPSATWYGQFAGILAAPADRVLTSQELEELAGLQIELVQGGPDGVPVPLAAEHPQGLHIRADNFVFRMSPGDSASVDFVATQFGLPLPNAKVVAQVSVMGTPAVPLPSPPPPTVGLTAPATATTGSGGRLSLQLSAHDLGQEARAFIDGQVYGLAYALDADIANTGTNANGSDSVSTLVWSTYPIPASPTWSSDVYPIFEQYAALYPYMKAIIDLGDYDQVVASKDDIAGVFNLPIEDPHYMPVTRDLSPAKRRMLISWLSSPNPAKGQALARARAAPTLGKGAFLARFKPPSVS